MNRRLLAAALTALVALSAVVVSSASAAATAAAAIKGPKPAHVAKGQPVNLTDYLVPGKTVVFDFYSDYCPPCVQVAPLLDELHRTNANVVVVKVDINRPGVKRIDFDSPVAKQYRLPAVPHFKVYGPDGKLKAEDGANSARGRDMVFALMERQR